MFVAGEAAAIIITAVILVLLIQVVTLVAGKIISNVKGDKKGE